MDVNEEITQISESLAHLQDELAKALPAAPSAELRSFLESMSEKLAKGRAEFAEVYKSATAKVDQQLAQAQDRAKSVQEKLSAAEEQLAIPPIPKMPEVPAKPAFAVDKELGQKLRDELLTRFAPDHAPVQQPGWKANREAWDDWADWSQN